MFSFIFLVKWSNQDLHLTCKGYAYSFTGTMLTPYRRHYRSSHALVVLLYSASKRAVKNQSFDILTVGASCMSSLKLIGRSHPLRLSLRHSNVVTPILRLFLMSCLFNKTPVRTLYTVDTWRRFLTTRIRIPFSVGDSGDDSKRSRA